MGGAFIGGNFQKVGRRSKKYPGGRWRESKGTYGYGRWGPKMNPRKQYRTPNGRRMVYDPRLLPQGAHVYRRRLSLYNQFMSQQLTQLWAEFDRNNTSRRPRTAADTKEAFQIALQRWRQYKAGGLYGQHQQPYSAQQYAQYAPEIPAQSNWEGPDYDVRHRNY